MQGRGESEKWLKKAESRKVVWGMRYLSTLVGCRDTALSLVSSFFSNWNFLNFLLIYSSFLLKWPSFLLPRLMTLPSLSSGVFSLLPQRVFCTRDLTLVLFCLTWLLVACFYLQHYILSFLDTRTGSYLYWYFLKCLACSRCSRNVGWTCDWELNSMSSHPKCTKPHIHSINSCSFY